MSGKLIIFSAPSGAGKSTLVQYLLSCDFGMQFSVSATNRAARGLEKHGEAYYFLSTDDFQQKILNKEFLEHEEVYKGCFYGTLRSEVDRITATGSHVVFDVDVVGGLSIKKQYPDRALALFIAPPSVDVLRQRLIARNTDSAEMIEKRMAKAAYEMSFAPEFDYIIVNDNLQNAKAEAESIIRDFLAQ